MRHLIAEGGHKAIGLVIHIGDRDNAEWFARNCLRD
jgi:hypothetical protein